MRFFKVEKASIDDEVEFGPNFFLIRYTCTHLLRKGEEEEQKIRDRKLIWPTDADCASEKWSHTHRKRNALRVVAKSWRSIDETKADVPDYYFDACCVFAAVYFNQWNFSIPIWCS